MADQETREPPKTDLKPLRSATMSTGPAHKKPIVIGIYGIPGSGKSFLMKQLKRELADEPFLFLEGSSMIDTVTPGGLVAFKAMKERQRLYYRELAIETAAHDAACANKVAVVAGHAMFWLEEEETGTFVYTPKDLETFTHILYLDVPGGITECQIVDDKERARPVSSAKHLCKWQDIEKIELRSLCREHNILFSLIPPNSTQRVAALLNDFANHNEEHNLWQAECALEEAVDSCGTRIEKMLLLDADKTLVAEDTGEMFLKFFLSFQKHVDDDNPLKTLFSSPLRYSYTAFRQATLLYEAALNDEDFDALCNTVASLVTIRPEFRSLLQMVVATDFVGAVIVTCGLRCIWEKVLEKAKLSKTIKVIGGGRLADGYVVTASVKAAMVTRLQDFYHFHVWAFGDSPLDLEMLHKADRAIVAVGEDQTRSKSMEIELRDAIDHGLCAKQVLLASNAVPRLNINDLPIVDITQKRFLDSIFMRRQIYHKTGSSAAKLLMTPMRDASLAGPALREAHRHVGMYLATELLSDLIGVEEYSIPHVQGSSTTGFRLLDEQRTCIVALMRGGEPMALGLNDALPLAMFVHAHAPDDVKLHHLQGQSTVLLVDSVVNSGKSAIEFVRHIRDLHSTIRIVVVAGVVQNKAIQEGSFAKALFDDMGLALVALRFSDNKYTGSKGTDKGNPLFNTVHLD